MVKKPKVQKDKVLWLCFVLIFSKLVAGGHVYSWDLEIEYQNSGYAKKFGLFFSLENPLSNTDYIKILFPIDLGKPLACLYEEKKLISQNTSSVPNQQVHTYIWPTQIELKANTWYNLIIYSDDEAISKQYEGIKDPIQFFTLSGISDSSPVIDQNQVFSVFSLAPPPKETLNIIFSYPSDDGSIEDMGYEYEVKFRIFPSLELQNGLYYKIEVTNPAFQFSKTCSSIDYNCLAQENCINIKKTQSFGCQVYGSYIMFDHIEDIKIGKNIAIGATVKNPNYSPNFKELHFIATSESKKAKIILERKIIETDLKVSLAEISLEDSLAYL